MNGSGKCDIIYNGTVFSHEEWNFVICK
jgi:hypothetical protein